MLFRIASLLGRRVDQIIAEMSADEFLEWVAFYDLEPWGFQAATWRAGVISSTVANYAGRSRKRADAKPSDFIPTRRSKPRRSLTRDEARQILEKGKNRNG